MRDSNSQPIGYGPSALTIELMIHLEQATGIEPAVSAWKAEVLPLYDTCLNWNVFFFHPGGLSQNMLCRSHAVTSYVR